MWITLVPWQGIVASILLAAGFVGSLYLAKGAINEDRDAPPVIKRRLVTISIFTLLSPILVAFWAVDEQTSRESGPSLLTWIGFTTDGLIPAMILPLLLTALLFLGPLILSGLQWRDALLLARDNDASWQLEHVQRAWLSVPTR